jgi:hypothetical protein
MKPKSLTRAKVASEESGRCSGLPGSRSGRCGRSGGCTSRTSKPARSRLRAARPQRAQAALVRQLGQRVGLVHELAELAAAEEILASPRTSALGLISFCGSCFSTVVEQGHALLDQALGAGQADPALVGQQFAHGAHPAAAEVVDVVQAALALLEAQEVFGGRDQILLGQDARLVLGARPSFWLIL